MDYGPNTRSRRFPISCRLVPTDQWLRTHISHNTTVEGLKIYLLDVFLGPVTPRNNLYKPPVPNANNPPSSSSPRRPLSHQPSLRLDTSRTSAPGTSSWNNISLTSPTSPVSSPISLAGDSLPTGYQSLRSLRTSPGNTHRSLHHHGHPTYAHAQNFSRHPSGSTTASGAAAGGGDSDRDRDDSDSDDIRSPVFASNPEYDYTSDIVDWEDLESPPVDPINLATFAEAGEASHFGGGTDTASQSTAEYSRGGGSGASKGILSSNIRKATSRVTFKSQKGLASEPPVGEFRTLTPEERRDETRERASNWVLFSFSNSHYLENHLPLSDYAIQPRELFELHRIGRLVSLDRSLYSFPHFNSIAYVGKVKNATRKRGGDRARSSNDSRTLSIRSSTSSINIKAHMHASHTSSVPTGTTSSTLSRRTSFANSADIGVSTVTERDGEGQVPVVVEPTTPSHVWGASAAAFGGGAMGSSGVFGGSVRSQGSTSAAQQQRIRSTPSLNFHGGYGKGGGLGNVVQSWKAKWITLHGGWLTVWKDRTTSKPPDEYRLDLLVSIREIYNESSLPVYGSQTFKVLAASFAVHEGDFGSFGPTKELFLNLPDDAMHQHLHRILYRVARRNRMLSSSSLVEEGRPSSNSFPSSSSPGPLPPHWIAWREHLFEQSVEAGRGDRRTRTTAAGRRRSLIFDPNGTGTLAKTAGGAEVYEVEADSASEHEWENWEDEFGGRESVRSFDFSYPPFTMFGGGRRGSTIIGLGGTVDDIAEYGIGSGSGGGSRFGNGSPGRDRSATIGASSSSTTIVPGSALGDGMMGVVEDGSANSRNRSKSVTAVAAGEDGRLVSAASGERQGGILPSSYYLSGHAFGG